MTILRRYWGFALFTGLSVLGLVHLLGQAMPGHYRVFTGAARAFAEGRDAYGTDFGTGVGDYFYSPACALYFFRLFAELPEKLGLALYVVLSWAVFVAGSWHAIRVFSHDRAGPLARYYWPAVAGPVYGALLASKLELIMTGILLLACAWVVERRRLVISGLLVATITAWKFQPLPVAGLLTLAWITPASALPWRMRFKWPLSFAGGLAFWFALPLFELGPARLEAQDQIWVRTFGAFVRDSYLNFENVFTTLHRATGWAISYSGSQLVTVAVGAALALNLLAWIRWVHPEPAWGWVTLLALGSGTVVMTAFSPLGQNNALVLVSPLIFAALWRIETSGKPLMLWVLFGFLWTVLTFSYSDLTPIVIREDLRYLCAKAGACLVLGAVWIGLLWRAEWMRMLNEKSKSLGRNQTARAAFAGTVAVVSLLSLARCGTSNAMNQLPSQDLVFQNYGLSYDDTSKTIIASAYFTRGDALGPRLILGGGAAVELSDGTQFREEVSQPDKNVFYQAPLGSGSASDVTRQFTFQFQDASGDEYDNTVTFNGGIALDPPTTQVSLTGQSTINYTTDVPPKSGERVEIHIRQNGGKGGEIVHQEFKPADGATTANVQSSEVSPLQAGPGFLQACRILDSVPLHHAKAGGNITVTACSVETPITITPAQAPSPAPIPTPSPPPVSSQ